MRSLKKSVLPVLFTATLIIMALVTFFGPFKKYSDNEKRMLATFPKLSWENIVSGKFQEELEVYISDHLMGRDMLVGVNAYYTKAMGKNALGNIYSAKGGYLVNAPKENADGHFEKNMTYIQSFASFAGGKATMIIVPSSGYIMEERLPAFHKSYVDDRLFETARNMTPSVEFLDMRSSFKKLHNRGKELYYRTDHHLTSNGSYEVYKAYCNLKGLTFPDKKEYNIDVYDGFYGTTYSGSGYWLTEADKLETWDLGESVSVTFDADKTCHGTLFFKDHLAKKDKYPVYLDGNHGYVRIENPSAKGGNLLIVRDSFGQNFAPFISHNYKNVYLVDMRYYRSSVKALFAKEKIDEVLFLFGIDTLLTDSSTAWLLI